MTYEEAVKNMIQKYQDKNIYEIAELATEYINGFTAGKIQAEKEKGL